VRRLFEQRLALGERLLELRRSYREGHPELATVEAKLSEVDRELREAARGFVERAHRAFEAAQWKEAEVSRLLAGHRAEAARLRSEFHRYEALKRQRDSYRAILDPLVKGRTELGLAATLDFASVVVETRPTRPGGPSRPNLVMHGLAGFAFGCVVAFGLALLLESLDETVRTPDDIVGAASLATVGVISRMGRGMARNARATALVAATQPGSIAGEQFRSLRTGILSLDGWSGRFRSGVVLVTSTDLGEGKTTVALNAAAVFSQLGQKAVVVDADLRRAAVHSALDIERVPGLVEYLEGSAKLADVVRPTRLPNLFVVPAGKATASPAEALAGPRAREIIEELKKEYATVWIDSPPVMPVGDARGLAPAADLVLVVVRSVVTRRRALKRTCELLTSESGRAVAAVLNCVPRSAEHQVGYRYQSRYYTSGARPDGGDE
jgi:capsular exopolysaccharide synthesis family protein